MSFPAGPHEEERLQILLETGALDPKQDPVLDSLCEEVRQHFGVPMCTVTLLDRARQQLKAAQDLDAGEMPRDVAFCNYTILTNEVFVVGDALEDERFRNNPLVTGAPYIRSYAGAPMNFLKNIQLEALCILDTKPRVFSRGGKAKLQLFAEWAVQEIAAQELQSP